MKERKPWSKNVNTESRFSITSGLPTNRAPRKFVIFRVRSSRGAVDFVLLPSRWNSEGTCNEDGNWWIVCAPPRADNARTGPHARVVVREPVIPSTPEHIDYSRRGGAGWNTRSAWSGLCEGAIQPAAYLLSSGSYAHSLFGL